MNTSLAVYRSLKCACINFAASVHCVILQELLTLVGCDTEIIHLPLSREEEEGESAPEPEWGGESEAAIFIKFLWRTSTASRRASKAPPHEAGIERL